MMTWSTSPCPVQTPCSTQYEDGSRARTLATASSPSIPFRRPAGSRAPPFNASRPSTNSSPSARKDAGNHQTPIRVRTAATATAAPKTATRSRNCDFRNSAGFLTYCRTYVLSVGRMVSENLRVANHAAIDGVCRWTTVGPERNELITRAIAIGWSASSDRTYPLLLEPPPRTRDRVQRLDRM